MLTPPRHRPRRLREHRLPAARVDRRGDRRDPRARGEDARGRAGARPAAALRPGARRRPPAPVSAHARDRLRASGRGPPDLHLHRGRAGDGRAAGDRADLRRRGRLRGRGDRRRLHRPRGRPVQLPRGQGAGDPRAGRARGHRPRRQLRVLRQRVRPADAAARRASCGRQSGQGTGARGARGGVGDHAVRATRAQAARRRGGGAARQRRGRRTRGARHEPARADRRPARDPRPHAPLRRREDRAAGRAVGPRAPLPRASSSRSSASSA